LLQELDNATSALSSHLLDECNLQHGDKVLLVFVPGLAFTASLLACFKAGLVAVPVYPPDPTRFGKELRHFCTIQRDCGATVALTHATYSFAKTIGDFQGFFSFGKKECEWPSLKWIQVDAVLKAGRTIPSTGRVNQPSETAFLQYTSGSTSAPKGVMVSTHNLSVHCAYILKNNGGACERPVAVSWLPQYHDMGLIGNYLTCTLSGCPGYFMSPVSFLKDPLSYLRLLAKYRATSSAAPSFAFALMLRKLKEAPQNIREEILALDLSSVYSIGVGAEPINAKVILEFNTVFKTLSPTAINPSYGLAEFTLQAGGNGRGRVQVDKLALEAKKIAVVEEGQWIQPYEAVEGAVALVSCGQRDPEHAAWAIVDPDTCTLCPADRVGELWLAGASKTLGYFNRPELTKEVFHAKIPGDERDWLRTGDSAFVYKHELYFCGRIKDLIIINGLNYYPQDAERSAEDSHDALRAGCSAAFAVTVEADATESAAYVAEVCPTSFCALPQ
jgi:acyl-CoA synthetase (AMP-forming)/AMP-acid ligase II